MSRRRAREVAMCLLYEREINLEPAEDTIKEMSDVLHSDRLEERNCQYIDDVLARLSEPGGDRCFYFQVCVSWKIERLSRVDISISAPGR